MSSRTLCPPSSINLGRRIPNNRSTDLRIDNLLKTEIDRRRKFASCRAWTFVKPRISNENSGNRWTGRHGETGSGLLCILMSHTREWLKVFRKPPHPDQTVCVSLFNRTCTSERTSSAVLRSNYSRPLPSQGTRSMHTLSRGVLSCGGRCGSRQHLEMDSQDAISMPIR